MRRVRNPAHCQFSSPSLSLSLACLLTATEASPKAHSPPPARAHAHATVFTLAHPEPEGIVSGKLPRHLQYRLSETTESRSSPPCSLALSVFFNTDKGKRASTPPGARARTGPSVRHALKRDEAGGLQLSPPNPLPEHYLVPPASSPGAAACTVCVPAAYCRSDNTSYSCLVPPKNSACLSLTLSSVNM